MLIIGIDENGYGPYLGPLVATSVSFETRSYSPASLKEILMESMVCDDSKRVSSWRKMEEAEKSSLILFYSLYREVPGSFIDLLSRIRVRDPSVNPPECDDIALSLCLPDMRIPLFTRMGFRELRNYIIDRGEGLIERLEANGVSLYRIDTIPLCVKRFNLMAEGMAKDMIDLHIFLLLMNNIIHSRRGKGGMEFICGKIGGRKRYSPHIPFFPLKEENEESSYTNGRGTNVRFVRDADSKHPPVSLASIIGKYVREAFMESFHRFVQGLVPEYRRVSGYPNPSTKDAILKILDRLRIHGVPERCILREK